jgi:hypothetical protein
MAGFYTYCPACREGLDRPSFRDVEKGKRMCPHCEAVTPVPETMADILEVLERRVELLEAKANKRKS